MSPHTGCSRTRGWTQRERGSFEGERKVVEREAVERRGKREKRESQERRGERGDSSLGREGWEGD